MICVAIRLGANDYLLKPFSKDDVEEMLAKSAIKLDKERKKAQIRTWFIQGQHFLSWKGRRLAIRVESKNLAFRQDFYLSVYKNWARFQDPFDSRERMKKS